MFSFLSFFFYKIGEQEGRTGSAQGKGLGGTSVVGKVAVEEGMWR
jgi:hypothetical protein